MGSTSLRDSDGDTKDSISTENTLIRGAIELNEEGINLLLLGNDEAGLDECGCNDIVDV